MASLGFRLEASPLRALRVLAGALYPNFLCGQEELDGNAVPCEHSVNASVIPVDSLVTDASRLETDGE